MKRLIALWVVMMFLGGAADAQNTRLRLNRQNPNKVELESDQQNLESWLNSPQLKELASRPELQVFISMFAKHIFVVNGKVFATDEFEPDPYPLEGAQVTVTCVGDTAEVYTAVSNDKGEFLVPIFLRQRLKSNDLYVKIAYIGMDGVNSRFTPTEKKLLGQKVQHLEFDSLVLRSNAVTLQEAEIIGELQKLYQKGDTVIFNADAFEMPSGSVLLDLVRRMPGLQYLGGKLTYMNRDIEEIRLNGDDFFKHDMSVALQNMPHAKLKSLKIYEVPDDTLDVMSDQHLVMDMNTKEAMNTVHTMNAGVGAKLFTFSNWEANADLSRWRKGGGQTRLSLSTSSIPSAGNLIETEINTRGNLSYEQQLGNTKLDGAVNYGYGRTQSRSSSVSQIYLPNFTQNSQSETTNGSKNRSWGGNISLDGHFGKQTYWNSRVQFNRSDTRSWSESQDSIGNDLLSVSSTRSRRESHSLSENVAWNGGLAQFWGDERQTSLSLDGQYSFRNTDNTSTNRTDTRFYLLGDSLRTVNQIIETPSQRHDASGAVTLRHRFGKYTNVDVSYSLGYSGWKETQSYNDILGDLLRPIDSLHYDNRFCDLSHGPRLQFQYDNKILLLRSYVRALPTLRTAENTQGSTVGNRFRGTQYQAYARMELKMHHEKNKLTLSYNGRNQLPTPNDISSVTDYSNPMLIRRGNPDLKAAFRHQMEAQYQVGSLMRITANYNLTQNQQTALSLIDPRSGVRTTMPTNINGNWGANGNLFVTKAIHDVSLIATGTYAYNHSVSFVQDYTQLAPQRSATNWQRVDASLIGTYSNKSLILMWLANYSLDHSRSDYTQTVTRGQQAGAGIGGEYTFPLKINLKAKTEFRYTRRFGYELASANRSEYNWTASLEYRFLDFVTASFEWRDILRSHNGFSASMSSTGWSETQQYGDTSMLLFRLSVRLFK